MHDKRQATVRKLFLQTGGVIRGWHGWLSQVYRAPLEARAPTVPPHVCAHKQGRHARMGRRSVCCSSRTFRERRGASEKTRDGFKLMVLPYRSVSDVVVGVPDSEASASAEHCRCFGQTRAPCCTSRLHSVLHTRPVLAPPESSMSATPSAAAPPGYLCSRPQQ